MRAKAAYGLGSIAYGIKDNGFSALLLLYYNQVIGLRPDLVGLVVMVALVLDAIIDPVIGHVSDNLQSRWGRRHPFMYASAIPVGILYCLLWRPPSGSPTEILLYMAVIAILVRTALSCYEVPSFALAPEMTSDYDERTSIMGYRYLFSWVGGMTMVLITFSILLAPAAHYPIGQLNPQGYRTYGVVAGLIMTVVILISAIGTHGEVRHLPKTVSTKASFAANLREILATFRHRPFVILMGAGMFSFANQGLGAALTTYFYTYLWQFPAYALALFTLSVIVGAIAAFALTPIVSRGVEKRHAAIACVLLSTVFALFPLLLRLVGWFPTNDSPMLLPILLVITAFGVVFLVGSSTLTASMMSDVVEHAQLKTGKRSEGVFFAGSFFMQKCVSGLGLFVSGAVLALARFPAAALPGHVPHESLQRLILYYCCIAGALALASVALLTRFPLGREDHEERLLKLAEIASHVSPLPGSESSVPMLES